MLESIHTGQVPPFMILSNVRESGMPAEQPERPERTEPSLLTSSTDPRLSSDATRLGRVYVSESNLGIVHLRPCKEGLLLIWVTEHGRTLQPAASEADVIGFKGRQQPTCYHLPASVKDKAVCQLVS